MKNTLNFTPEVNNTLSIIAAASRNMATKNLVKGYRTPIDIFYDLVINAENFFHIFSEKDGLLKKIDEYHKENDVDELPFENPKPLKPITFPYFEVDWDNTLSLCFSAGIRVPMYIKNSPYWYKENMKEVLKYIKHH